MTMSEKQKMVNVDGMLIPSDVWEEIKDTYTNAPTAWEEQAKTEILRIAKNCLHGIDKLLTESDYTPETSSDKMWEIALAFSYNDYVQEAINNDEVLTSRLLEILGGINTIQKENEILTLISVAFTMIRDTERLTWH